MARAAREDGTARCAGGEGETPRAQRWEGAERERKEKTDCAERVQREKTQKDTERDAIRRGLDGEAVPAVARGRESERRMRRWCGVERDGD